MREAVTNSTPRLLHTTRTAARLLSVTERTLYSLAKGGDLPRVVLPGGAIRYAASDLEAFIENRKGAHVET